MERLTIHVDRNITIAQAEEIGRRHGIQATYPSYFAPYPLALNRELHDAWLRGYSAVAAVRWPEYCIAVR